MACHFFWRQSNEHGFDKANQARAELAVGEAPKTLKLGDYAIATKLGEERGGVVLDLEVEAAASGVLAQERYAFATASPDHLPASGHGFTGLRYLTHPGSGSELQYFCGSYGQSANLDDDAVAHSRPGPKATNPTQLSCELELQDGDGVKLEAKSLEIADPTGAGANKARSATLGDFSFEVRYLSNFEGESGGPIIDAKVGGKPFLHTLFQAMPPAMPTNLTTDAGFTGQRTLVSGSGQRLTYRCAI